MDQVHEKISENIFINLGEIRDLKGTDILLMTNPSSGLKTNEINVMAEWIRNGGKLLVTASNARRDLSAIPSLNTLLNAAGSGMRINADELVDRANNTGKPWSVLVKNFADRREFRGIRDAVFWGAASLVNPSGNRLKNGAGVTILALTSPDAKSRVFDDFPVGGGVALQPGEPIPVAAMENIGRGAIVLLGANTFSDFQYPTEEDRRTLDPLKWDHDTDEFNLAVVNVLKE